VTNLMIVAAIAASVIVIAHICAFVLALRSVELKTKERLGWAAVSFLGLLIAPISPVPFFYFFVEISSAWRLMGTLTLIAIISFDVLLLWGHAATDENYERSVLLMHYLPVAGNGWVTTDEPHAKPFIDPTYILTAQTTRTYRFGDDHEITLSIQAITPVHERGQATTPPEPTSPMNAAQNGRTYIQDCPVSYFSDQHRLELAVGDYKVGIWSKSEPISTLESLARGMDLYGLWRSNY